MCVCVHVLIANGPNLSQEEMDRKIVRAEAMHDCCKIMFDGQPGSCMYELTTAVTTWLGPVWDQASRNPRVVLWGAREVLALPKGLLAIEGHWKRENQFSTGMWSMLPTIQWMVLYPCKCWEHTMDSVEFFNPMVAHSSIHGTEAGRSQWVWNHSCPHSHFKVSQSCIVRPCFKTIIIFLKCQWS